MVEILVELGRIEEAKEAIKEGRELFPDSARLYCIEAGIAIQQGNLAQARSLYEKALEVNPEYIHAYLGLSRLDLMEKKDTYELLDRCTKVIEFEGPESEWTTQALDLMLQRLKKE